MVLKVSVELLLGMRRRSADGFNALLNFWRLLHSAELHR